MTQQQGTSTKLTWLREMRDSLIQQKIDNTKRMGELEYQICQLEGELNLCGRNDQRIALQLSQTNKQLSREEDEDFRPKIIEELKKVIDRETYLKCVDAVKLMVKHD